MKAFSIDTKKMQNCIDITEQIKKQVNITSGICNVFVPHTSCAITINESDGRLNEDIMKVLDKLVPARAGYLHDEIDGNAEAHVKSAIVGNTLSIPVEKGNLVLGTWQNILLLEFDGPRQRDVVVKLFKG